MSISNINLTFELLPEVAEQLAKLQKMRENQRNANKKYRESHPEKFRNYSKKYYEANREKQKETMKQYYIKSKKLKFQSESTNHEILPNI